MLRMSLFLPFPPEFRYYPGSRRVASCVPRPLPSQRSEIARMKSLIATAILLSMCALPVAHASGDQEKRPKDEKKFECSELSAADHKSACAERLKKIMQKT